MPYIWFSPPPPPTHHPPYYFSQLENQVNEHLPLKLKGRELATIRRGSWLQVDGN